MLNFFRSGVSRFLGCLCILLVSSSVVHAVEVIDKVPYSITKAGNYQLASDMEFGLASGAAISITASDVDLDLGGHRLEGTAGDETGAVGITANSQSRITVRNGTVSGFYFGIDFRRKNRDAETSSGHRVIDLTLDRNWYFGIRIEGTDSKIEGCSVQNTGGCARPSHTIPHAVRMVGAGNTLENTDIKNLWLRLWPDDKGEVVGVHFDDALGSVLKNNRIEEQRAAPDETSVEHSSKPRRFAVWINGGPDHNSFLTAEGNTFRGFDVAMAFTKGTDGLVRGNTFIGGETDPIRGAPAAQTSDNKVVLE